MLVHITEEARVSTAGQWFGPPDETSFGWLSRSADARRCGVVIVPPFGYEYWTTHRSLRVLAESLAAAGFLVLRLDLRGTGDATGDLWTADDSLASWRSDIANGVTELRRLGADSVSLVGLRFGATLAFDTALSLSVDKVVGWVPVLEGRRYARELSMLSTIVPADSTRYGDGETRVLAGTVITEKLLAGIAGVSTKSVGKPAREVLVLDRDDRPGSSGLVSRLRDNAVEVEHRELGGVGSMLDVPTEDATVPGHHIDAITRYLAPVAASAEPLTLGVASTPGGIPSTDVRRIGTATIREEINSYGPLGLVGVEASPVDGNTTGVTVLFLNTGSESHVGSGRVWVEFSRALAAEGSTAIRLDFRGWGESPDDGFAPGRPYDQHAIDDVRETVLALRRAGHRHIVAVGLCAGAWVGLRDISSLPIDAFIGFNPQLYWRPGDPVEARMSDTRKRRLDDIAEIKAGAESGEWTRLDATEPPCDRGQWIEDLASANFPVVLAFSPGDDGLEYLDDRFHSRMERVLAAPNSSLSVVSMARLDHPMHQHWNRDEGLTLIRETVARI